MTLVAALYTERGGVYSDLPDVDAWDEARDARLYAGPWPVVAHPPCARWCRLAGLVEARWGHRRGDDVGCFASALASVRRWGGVLEHPAYSDAWTAFDLPTPPTGGGWVRGICGGWSCYVEQARYGHPAKKATWLYLVTSTAPPRCAGVTSRSGTCARSWAGAAIACGAASRGPAWARLRPRVRRSRSATLSSRWRARAKTRAYTMRPRSHAA